MKAKKNETQHKNHIEFCMYSCYALRIHAYINLPLFTLQYANVKWVYLFYKENRMENKNGNK